jgi:hypothetical protein
MAFRRSGVRFPSAPPVISNTCSLSVLPIVGRELFRAVEIQLDQAQIEIRRARNKGDQERAEARQREAMRQRNLLLRIGAS